MKSTAVSREPIIIETIGRTAGGLLLHVIRVHSSAIFCGLSRGFQASRPSAYQFAWSKLVPLQLRSVPTFDTPANAEIVVDTGVPQRAEQVSAIRASVHIGPR